MKQLNISDIKKVNGGLANSSYYNFELLVGKEVIGCHFDIIGYDTVTTEVLGPGIFDTTYIVEKTPVYAVTPVYQKLSINAFV
jgi:hypothetical protein